MPSLAWLVMLCLMHFSPPDCQGAADSYLTFCFPGFPGPFPWHCFPVFHPPVCTFMVVPKSAVTKHSLMTSIWHLKFKTALTLEPWFWKIYMDLLFLPQLALCFGVEIWSYCSWPDITRSCFTSRSKKHNGLNLTDQMSLLYNWFI